MSDKLVKVKIVDNALEVWIKVVMEEEGLSRSAVIKNYLDPECSIGKKSLALLENISGEIEVLYCVYEYWGDYEYTVASDGSLIIPKELIASEIETCNLSKIALCHTAELIGLAFGRSI